MGCIIFSRDLAASICPHVGPSVRPSVIFFEKIKFWVSSSSFDKKVQFLKKSLVSQKKFSFSEIVQFLRNSLVSQKQFSFSEIVYFLKNIPSKTIFGRMCAAMSPKERNISKPVTASMAFAILFSKKSSQDIYTYDKHLNLAKETNSIFG